MRKLRRLIFSFLLLSCLVLIGLGLIWKNFVETPLLVGKSEIVFVPPGSSINSVANLLHAKGMLPHPRFFVLLAQLQNKTKSIKTGEYRVDSGILPNQFLTKLVEGKVVLRHFTIVEGWTLKQVFNSINSNRYLTHTINLMSAEDFSKKLGANYNNFEGFLYPDTYLFAAGVTDITILKKAFGMMQRNLNTLWQNRAPGLPYNDPYSALVAASLIEKETARPEERAKIAGVIVRRLQKNMLLQIDASVIYGLGDNYTGKITYEDLKKDTPFNTYLHAGLPPTPIAMPSLPSVIAALHPEAGTALYYVAKGDGSHVFTANLKQHHDAVMQFRARLKASQEITDLSWISSGFIPWFTSLDDYQLNQVFNLIPYN